MNTKLLRQRILDLAIRGKLVPQDPNDEPASVLLERIRAQKEQLVADGKIKKTKHTDTSDKPHYQNTPFDIPNSWQWVSVSDIFQFNPKNHIEDYTEVGFIPMECVKDGYSGTHSYYTKQWKDVKQGYTHFQNGDIGIAKISPCFENRKSTIFCNLPNGYGSGSTELSILRPIGIDPKFYLNVFKSTWYIHEGSKNFKGNVGQQRVSKDIFTTLYIPLPPLAEQKRIVAEVEKWFALIDDLEANKQDLQTAVKRTKAKVLDLAIHGKLVPQDPADEPAIDLLHRINPHFTPSDTSHYQNLPNSWQIGILKDVARTLTSKNYQILQSEIQKSGEYPVISQSANYIEGYCNQVEKLYHHEQPIIIFGDHTRAVKYVDCDFVVGADGVKIILPLINAKYLYYLILYASSNIKDRGYGRHFGYLSKFELLIPPLTEQARIATKLEYLSVVIQEITADL